MVGGVEQVRRHAGITRVLRFDLDFPLRRRKFTLKQSQS